MKKNLFVLIFTILFLMSSALNAKNFEKKAIKRAKDRLIKIEKKDYYSFDCLGILIGQSEILTFSKCIAGDRDLSASKYSKTPTEHLSDLSIVGKNTEDHSFFKLRYKSGINSPEFPIMNEFKNVKPDEKILIVYSSGENTLLHKTATVTTTSERGFSTDATNFVEGSPDDQQYRIAFNKAGEVVGYMSFAGIWTDDYKYFSEKKERKLKFDDDTTRPGEHGIFISTGDFSYSVIPESTNSKFWLPGMLGYHYNQVMAGIAINVLDGTDKFFVSFPLHQFKSKWILASQLAYREIHFTEDSGKKSTFTPEFKLSYHKGFWGMSLYILPQVKGHGIGL